MEDLIATKDEFRAWRERLGLTRRQAASALGISSASVRAMEEGRRPIRRPTAMLCKSIEEKQAKAE